MIVVPEKFVGDGDHVGEVHVVCTDAAEDPEYALNQKGGALPASFGKVSEGIKMTDVVALELESCSAALAELAEGVLDLIERVLERVGVRVLHIGFSQSYRQLVILSAIPENTKFIDPMFNDASSGLNVAAAESRCCIDMDVDPPVEMFNTASVSCATRGGRNCSKTSGSKAGRRPSHAGHAGG